MSPETLILLSCFLPLTSAVMDMVRILSKLPPLTIEPYNKWQWSSIGPEGKMGRVYTFPLTFGAPPPLKMEKRDDSLTSLPSWLEERVEEGELSQTTSELLLSISSAGKIVSAISRYPVARARAGSREKYNSAAETAFQEEISARPGSTGLLFLRNKTEPSLLYSGQTTAVSLTPLLCQDNVLSGLPHASVFVLSDMEWDGLRPRMAGYFLYSSVTVLVLSLADAVVEFTLDQDDVFRLTDDNVSVPSDDTFYNVNYDQRVFDSLSGVKNLTVRVHSTEDCLISDVHRVLKRGGLYVDTAGAFSTLYLLTPVAMIMTRAGGVSTNGTHPILDLKPKSKEDTSPAIFGSEIAAERLTIHEEESRTYFPPLP